MRGFIKPTREEKELLLIWFLMELEKIWWLRK